MKQIDFRVPRKGDLTFVEKVIEEACAGRGLTVAMKGSLASYPGSIHWHFKNQKQKGTLEITFHLKDRRIWAQVHDGRRAPWIDAELPLLQRQIEKELRARSSASISSNLLKK